MTEFIKTFLMATVVFLLLASTAFGIAAVSDISPVLTVSVFALAIVAYLLSDEVVR